MVAAQSEPDEIEVHYRPWLDDRFSVGRCVVGSKKTKVVMAEEGDTLEEDVDAEHTSALCIGRHHSHMTSATFPLHLDCKSSQPLSYACLKR